MDQGLLAALAAGIAAAIAALATWLRTRRTTSGRVDTSDAAVVWQQAQANYAVVLARAEKAEAQRDRLIDSQAGQLLPALASISEGLGHITDSLTRIEARVGAGGGGERRGD